MIKRTHRTRDFEVSLQIKTDQFINPPREAQRNWMLNRALKEFGDDLEAINASAREFIPGGTPMGLADRTHSDLSDAEIMEDWQIPVMQAMVEMVCKPSSEVLEIGFGRGIASEMIQQAGVSGHTVVECNESVIERFRRWRDGHADSAIHLIEGRWQDTVSQFKQYDAVFFHTYPLNEQEFIEFVANSSTFAEHFFHTAAQHLRPNGRFTYLTNEIDSLSRGHQRALLAHFTSFTVQLLKGLEIPDDSRDAQWAKQTALVAATK